MRNSEGRTLDAYRADRAALLRRRITLAASLFLVSIGVSAVAEYVWRPERMPAVALILGAQTLACLIGVAAARTVSRGRHVSAVAVGLVLVLTLLADCYLVLVGAPLEQVAMTQVCLLAGGVVLLPWAWQAQLVVSLGAVAIFVIVAPWVEAHLPWFQLAFPVVVLAGASVAAALLIDRSRAEAFTHAVLKTEEAEVSAALARVGDTLQTYLHDPVLLERLTDLGAALLGCAWSGTCVWDERACAFTLQAGARADAALPETVEASLGPATVPPVRTFRPGELVEVADAAVPADAARLGITAVIYAPVFHHGHVRAVLVYGYRARARPCSPTQRRLARGIAQATAVAIENARLIDELRTASRLKSEFVATMSHELRTPINVISGYADLLEEGAFGSLEPAQREVLRRMSASALALHELVGATLGLGRLEAGRESVELADVEIDTLLGAVERELESLVADGVTLRWDVAPRPLAVRTDRVKLKTIVQNLVGNALKFTTAGTVEARVAWDRDVLTIVVRDTGIGIEAASLPIIFDVFRQVDGSNTRRFGGVGLGLHIVKRLIDLLEGDIDVASVPGEGSTFTVTLPAPRVAPADTMSA